MVDTPNFGRVKWLHYADRMTRRCVWENGLFSPLRSVFPNFSLHDAFPFMLVLSTVEGSLGSRNTTTAVEHSLFQTYRFFPQGCDDDMQGGMTCSHFVSLLLLPLLCTTNISKPIQFLSLLVVEIRSSHLSTHTCSRVNCL